MLLPSTISTSWLFLGIGMVLALIGLTVYVVYLSKQLAGLRRGRVQNEQSKIQFLIRAEKLELESSRGKNAFLAHVGHELRTPLNIIIGYSEIMEESCETPDQKAFLPEIGKIRNAGRELQDKINNILELSRIESGGIQVIPDMIRTANLVRDLERGLAGLRENSSNQLVLNTEAAPEFLEADFARLDQVLNHLLLNAFKYTREGTITFQVNRDLTLGHPWTEFRVVDTGPGIAEKLLPGLFSGFVRTAEAVHRETGLGLAISKSLCRAMGGDLTVESEVGHGTTFVARLPIGAAPGEVISPADKKRAEILIINDRMENSNLLKNSLVEDGLIAYLAGSEGEALNQALHLLPAVIVIDGMMPAMGGWATLQSIKNDEKLAQIPVILTTMMDDVTSTYQLGVMGYLNKPVDQQRLLDVVKRNLPRKTNKPILLVEDDRGSRFLVCSILQSGGWQVLEANNGAEALRSIQEQVPALVLLDLLMPEMDGYTFFSELRRREEWRQIPVVFISSARITPETKLDISGPFIHLRNNGNYGDADFLKKIKRQISVYINQSSSKRTDPS